MPEQTPDLRVEILKWLRAHDEEDEAKRGLPDLDSLVSLLGRPRREVRRACDALEADEFVTGSHSMGGDLNPSYMIMTEGKAFLYDGEHGSL